MFTRRPKEYLQLRLLKEAMIHNAVLSKLPSVFIFSAGLWDEQSKGAFQRLTLPILWFMKLGYRNHYQYILHSYTFIFIWLTLVGINWTNEYLLFSALRSTEYLTLHIKYITIHYWTWPSQEHQELSLPSYLMCENWQHKSKEQMWVQYNACIIYTLIWWGGIREGLESRWCVPCLRWSILKSAVPSSGHLDTKTGCFRMALDSTIKNTLSWHALFELRAFPSSWQILTFQYGRCTTSTQVSQSYWSW